MGTVKSDLPENISRLQAERGETDYRIAKCIGVHRGSIANWKNGIKPHPRNLRKLARHFGVTVEELTGGGKDEVSSGDR